MRSIPKPSGSIRDLIGTKIGLLLIGERDLDPGLYEKYPSYNSFHSCKCDCGTMISLPTTYIMKKNVKHCGCLTPNARDITGEKFGKLICIGKSDHVTRDGRREYGLWDFSCECGNKVLRKKKVEAIRGTLTSCGCWDLSRFGQGHKSSGIRFNKQQDRKIANKAGQYLSRSKNSGIPFDLDIFEMKKIFLSNCAYCGGRPEDVGDSNGFNGIDKVDPNGGYVSSNCVPCCWTCNSFKSNYEINEFKTYIHRVSSHLRL